MAFPSASGASPLLLAASQIPRRPAAVDNADPIAPLQAAIAATQAAAAAEQDPPDRALIEQALQLLHQVAQNNTTESAGPGGGRPPFGP